MIGVGVIEGERGRRRKDGEIRRKKDGKKSGKIRKYPEKKNTSGEHARVKKIRKKKANYQPHLIYVWERAIAIF
jgi:hypothetical protein